jgi:hypothetical protein
MGGFDAMKVFNFGGKDKHLDPPDLPDEGPVEGIDFYECRECKDPCFYSDVSPDREDEQLLCRDCWGDQYD